MVERCPPVPLPVMIDISGKDPVKKIQMMYKLQIFFLILLPNEGPPILQYMPRSESKTRSLFMAG